MIYEVTVIPGDGVGKEIVNSAKKVLNAIGKKTNKEFSYKDICVGGESIDKYNEPLTKEALDICKKSKAILLGAIGGPKWDNCEKRPELAILGLRKELGLFANIRPAIFRPYAPSSPLSSRILEKGIDILMVRELTAGIYFGKRGEKKEDNKIVHYDTEQITDFEIERTIRLGFELARKRRKVLCSVDKANVMHTSRRWRHIANEVSKEFSDVKLNHLYVDNCAMQLVLDPSQFDVVVTSNLFGDILSDIMAATVGSIGLMPSYSYANKNQILYEPIHGSAPDIAGKNIVNPIATILSCAMMLEHSFNCKEESKMIEDAVNKVLMDGYRTLDIYDESKGHKLLNTSQMTDCIINEINNSKENKIK